jgi:hypothetical protein
MDQQTQLLADIDAFTAAFGMSESTFGRLAVNDGKFVARIRGGGNMTVPTMERVRAFMAKHKAEQCPRAKAILGLCAA